MTTADYRRRADDLLRESRLAADSLALAESRLGEAETDLAVCEDAAAAVQTCAALVQAAVHNQITAVVTRCLAAVFDEPYAFKIEIDKARGKTEAVLVLERGGVRLTDPLFEAGGGVVDVAAFALRVACLAVKAGGRKLLVADEPMKNVNGAAYQDRVGRMVESLARELGFQFIFCTDDEWLKVGNVVRV